MSPHLQFGIPDMRVDNGESQKSFNNTYLKYFNNTYFKPVISVANPPS